MQEKFQIRETNTIAKGWLNVFPFLAAIMCGTYMFHEIPRWIWKVFGLLTLLSIVGFVYFSNKKRVIIRGYDDHIEILPNEKDTVSIPVSSITGFTHHRFRVRVMQRYREDDQVKKEERIIPKQAFVIHADRDYVLASDRFKHQMEMTDTLEAHYPRIPLERIEDEPDQVYETEMGPYKQYL